MNQWLFSLFLPFFIKRVQADFGKELAQKIRSRSKLEYKKLLPRIPKVDGLRNHFAAIVVANGWFIATYKAMKSEGYTVDQNMKIWAEMFDSLFRKIPGWLQIRIGKLLTSKPTINSFHRQAKNSQLRTYPGDWVYQINDVKGVDLAFEFEECAAIKMYRDLGVEEMSPTVVLEMSPIAPILGLGSMHQKPWALALKPANCITSVRGTLNTMRVSSRSCLCI